LLFLVFISIEERSYKLLMSSFAVAVAILVFSIFFDLQTKRNNELVIYQSDKTNVLAVFSGNTYSQLSDTIPDDRLQSTLRENKTYHDVVFEKKERLTNTSLLVVNHKRILFAKNVVLLSQQFITAIKPDYIWIAGNSLKKVKLPEFLCNRENVIVTGKFYNKKAIACLTNAYLTYKQGAFVYTGFDK